MIWKHVPSSWNLRRGWWGSIPAVLLVCSLSLSPSRSFLSVYMASLFWVLASLGASFLLALEQLTGASWLRPFRSVLIRTSSWQSPSAVLFFLVLVFSAALAPWYEETTPSSPFQQMWFHPGFFLLRSALYLATWVFFSRRLSRPQEAGGRGSSRTAAWFMPLFSITFWLCCVDWVLSWIPGWQTTLFAFYRFSALLLLALSTCLLLDWYRRERSSPGPDSAASRVDYGRFLFFASCLWAYLWYSLYLITWYAAVPAENLFLATRMQSNWGSVFLLGPVFCWLLPFVVLLVPGVKKNRGLMAILAGVILLGCWMDTYVLIFPDRYDFGLLWMALDMAPSVLLLGLLGGRVAPGFRGHRLPVSMDGVR